MAPSFRYEPDYAVAPGDSLRHTLTERGMTQADLAARTGLSTKHINQIAQGVAPITAETSLLFEKATDVPARTWNALESLYRERLARRDNRAELAKDAEWLEYLPLKELIRRGRVTQDASKPQQVEEVCRFFGVADRERWRKLWLKPLVSFRQSTSFTADSGAVATWIRLGELEASLIDTEPFDARTFRDALAEVRGLTVKEPRRALKHLAEICTRAGVAVVFLPDIGKTRASGAARWLTPTKALILLSDRYKSDDHFWFSFFHEAGHLLLHSKKETFVSKDDKQAKTAALTKQEELEANTFAANQLIPRRYESCLPQLHSEADVEEFANELGIAAGIVVGRLHNDGYWDWGKGNHLRAPIDFEHLLK
jgi:HTH-type transcriptional regulator/antitoxin HigA